jgi:hypothetical protein
MHKRLLLHPFSIMVILCTGVLLTGSTYRSIAANYDVTAVVPASLPSAPAVIQQPTDQLHVSTDDITVSGSCPAASYVKLYRSGIFSGTAICTNQSFQMQTSLVTGANQLQARVYNVTNQEGPTSAPITVFYDETTVTPPATAPSAVPTTVWVDQIEDNDYKNGSVALASPNPTVTGYAPPYADVTVTFHSVVTTCKTKADGQGWWTCTLDTDLPPGLHEVEIEAITPSGQHLSIPAFTINVRTSIASKYKPAHAQLLIISEYQYQTHYVGQPFTWSLGVNGGTPPYTLSIDWGDGSQSNITRPTGASFSLTHAYPEVKVYPVLVRSTDSNGQVAVLQLSAVVKGEAIGAASLTTTGPVSTLFASVQRYLWIAWPVYIAVVLMVLSYWLGEQEVYQKARLRRQTRGGAGKGRSL